jgi:PPE-repeat protein
VFGTSIVPVTPLGTGLTPGDVAGGKPLGPTGAPGADPSEEVTPSGGVSMPTWASAGLQHSKGKVVATKKDLMDDFPDKSERTAQRAAARTAVDRAAWTTFFSMVSARS